VICQQITSSGRTNTLRSDRLEKFAVWSTTMAARCRHQFAAPSPTSMRANRPVVGPAPEDHKAGRGEHRHGNDEPSHDSDLAGHARLGKGVLRRLRVDQLGRSRPTANPAVTSPRISAATATQPTRAAKSQRPPSWVLGASSWLAFTPSPLCFLRRCACPALRRPPDSGSFGVYRSASPCR
jgi:hypothetical protein